MKKALMYLLLALGICLIMAFIGGAVVGFVSGVIDGYNESVPGTTDSKNILISSGMVVVLLACVVLQIVFLRLRYASYDVGSIPKAQRWKVMAWLVPAMVGLALIYLLMYNPLADSNETTRSSYFWIKEHPFISLPYLILIEATGDLILFGAVLREILQWKHYPQIVLPVFAAVLSFSSGLFSSTMLFVPAFLLAMLEGYIYEYSRSVIPVIIADAIFWIAMVGLLGVSIPGWCFFVGCLLIVPSTYFVVHTMEPYKPID
jgi:hypothetical protein